MIWMFNCTVPQFDDFYTLAKIGNRSKCIPIISKALPFSKDPPLMKFALEEQSVNKNTKRIKVSTQYLLEIRLQEEKVQK